MPADSKSRFDDSTAAQQRFLSLFLRSEREIFRYVAALVPDVTDVEDIVQQTALAQLVFYSGARVVIEGPAELQVVSPTEAVCPTGRLLAEVPQPARGFRLKTDHLNVVDLGTAFGIDATHGRTEVQIVASPPVLTLDKLGMWLHLAVVVDGKARQVVHYVNGSPVVRQELKLGPPFRLGAAELGNWNAKSGPNPAPALIRNLSGALDEFELFNRALSDAEVRELYSKGKPDV